MLKMAKTIVLVLVLVLLLQTMTFSQTGKYLNKIYKSGELRVGTSGGQPPFTMKAKDGELFGYEIELAELLTEALNLKLTFVEKPFSELLPALEKGEVDIVMSGMSITPSRNMNFTFVGPYIISGKSIVGKSKRFEALNELDEINNPNVTIAALKGSTSQYFVENNASKVKLITTPTYDEAVKMILDDKVDLMVADYPICLLSMLKYQDADLLTLEEPLTLEPIGIALKPDAFQLHNLLSNYLTALEMSGVLQFLEAKWFEDGSWLFRLP